LIVILIFLGQCVEIDLVNLLKEKLLTSERALAQNAKDLKVLASDPSFTQENDVGKFVC
jgi:hypothetical protein